MPSITTLSPLTPSDLRRVLTEVKSSLVSQYTALFAYSGIDIRFTSAAIDQICKMAYTRGGGARGLRGIMVGALMPSRIVPTVSHFTWLSLGDSASRPHVRSSVSSTGPHLRLLRN